MVDLQFKFDNAINIKFKYEISKKKLILDDIGKLKFNYKVIPEIKVDVESGTIYIKLDFKVVMMDTNEVIVDGAYLFTFLADNFKSYIVSDTKGNSWKFKKDSNNAKMKSLVGTSLSTLRGILIEKLKGTIVEQSPMPLMSL